MSVDLVALRAERAAWARYQLDEVPAYRKVSRTLLVASILGRQGLGYFVFDVPRFRKGSDGRNRAQARRLLRTLQRLGPTYVKVGQFIASGRGMFPEHLVDGLAPLRDQCDPVPWRKIDAELAATLGAARVRLVSIDPVPLATASVAQVHAGVLDDGTEVVVKVRRPGLPKTVASYLSTMRRTLTLLGRVFGLNVIDLDSVSELIAHTIALELDFRLEAGNLARAAVDFESLELTSVVVPRVVEGLVTESVVVMERIDGCRLDDPDIEPQVRARVVTMLLKILVRSATERGWFHGDLHAANVLLAPDGRAVLLDFGIVANLEPAQAEGVGEILRAALTRDEHAIEQALVKLGLPAGGGTPRQQRESADVASSDSPLLEVLSGQSLTITPAVYLLIKNLVYLTGSARRDGDSFSIRDAAVAAAEMEGVELPQRRERSAEERRQRAARLGLRGRRRARRDP